MYGWTTIVIEYTGFNLVISVNQTTKKDVFLISYELYRLFTPLLTYRVALLCWYLIIILIFLESNNDINSLNVSNSNS
jgi:hypothetical protein